MNADMRAAIDMLTRLADVPPEQRMDTLALAIKCYIEAGHHWSPLCGIWSRIEESR